MGFLSWLFINQQGGISQVDQRKNLEHQRMSLHELLCSSAQRWAATALDAYMEDPPDLDFAVHHMAVAVEHLSKAYLCSITDVLLIERTSVQLDHLLILAGHEDRASLQRSNIRTVGGDELFKRVEQLLGRKPAGKSDKDLRDLREARNGITHLGLGKAADDVRELLATGIACLNDLLTELDQSTATFWGVHDQLATQLVERTIADRQLRYNKKLQLAVANFQHQFGRLLGPPNTGAVATLSPIPTLFGFSVETTCPACGRGDVPVNGAQYSRRAEDSSLRVWFEPESLSCRVCGLTLEGDELRFAGIIRCFIGEHTEGLDSLPEWDADHDL